MGVEVSGVDVNFLGIQDIGDVIDLDNLVEPLVPLEKVYNQGLILHGATPKTSLDDKTGEKQHWFIMQLQDIKTGEMFKSSSGAWQVVAAIERLSQAGAFKPVQVMFHKEGKEVKIGRYTPIDF